MRQTRSLRRHRVCTRDSSRVACLEIGRRGHPTHETDARGYSNSLVSLQLVRRVLSCCFSKQRSRRCELLQLLLAVLVCEVPFSEGHRNRTQRQC